MRSLIFETPTFVGASGGRPRPTPPGIHWRSLGILLWITSIRPAPQPCNPNAEVAHFPVDFPTFGKGWGEWPPHGDKPRHFRGLFWMRFKGRSTLLVKWNIAQQIYKSQHSRDTILYIILSPCQHQLAICIINPSTCDRFCLHSNESSPKSSCQSGCSADAKEFCHWIPEGHSKTNSCTFANWMEFNGHTRRSHMNIVRLNQTLNMKTASQPSKSGNIW